MRRARLQWTTADKGLHSICIAFTGGASTCIWVEVPCPVAIVVESPTPYTAATSPAMAYMPRAAARKQALSARASVSAGSDQVSHAQGLAMVGNPHYLCRV